MTTETPAADIVWRIHTRINDAPIETEYMLDEAATEINRLRDLNAELQRKLDEVERTFVLILEAPMIDHSDAKKSAYGIARSALTSIRGEA